MGKYDNLTAYLAALEIDQITLSILQIEKILGFTLPPSAKTYDEWWSNDYSSKGRQCKAWLSIGWRKIEIKIGEEVTFTKKKPTYLITWNPEKWEWDDIEDDIETFIKNGKFIDRWSSGNTKKILPGDRVFLLRQTIEPKGIFASGWAVSGCTQDTHWEPEKAKQGLMANYVKIQYDVLLNPFVDSLLTRKDLGKSIGDAFPWNTRSSGITIDEDMANILEQKWKEVVRRNQENAIPEEVEATEVHKEGALKVISINAYERNAEARRKCIEHYGCHCYACGDLLVDKYGERAMDFIHIHHTVPLGEIREEYEVNPIEDLKPLCPNCHAVVHRYKPALSIEELIAIIKQTL